MRLYPSHPTYNLLAAEARIRLLNALGPTASEAPSLTKRAREQLLAARLASQETRLVRLKLTQPQAARLARLLERLGPA